MTIQPNALYQFTGSQLVEFAKELAQYVTADASSRKQLEMCTRQVKAALLLKGYRVNSPAALQQTIKQLGITPTKRGKENWYPTHEIEAIPHRTLEKHF